jgi:hypothetical protein
MCLSVSRTISAVTLMLGALCLFTLAATELGAQQGHGFRPHFPNRQPASSMPFQGNVGLPSNFVLPPALGSPKSGNNFPSLPASGNLGGSPLVGFPLVSGFGAFVAPNYGFSPFGPPGYGSIWTINNGVLTVANSMMGFGGGFPAVWTINNGVLSGPGGMMGLGPMNPMGIGGGFQGMMGGVPVGVPGFGGNPGMNPAIGGLPGFGPAMNVNGFPGFGGVSGMNPIGFPGVTPMGIVGMNGVNPLGFPGNPGFNNMFPRP